MYTRLHILKTWMPHCHTACSVPFVLHLSGSFEPSSSKLQSSSSTTPLIVKFLEESTADIDYLCSCHDLHEETQYTSIQGTLGIEKSERWYAGDTCIETREGLWQAATHTNTTNQSPLALCACNTVCL